ncbi:MAG: trigger factor [Rickettsiales bacterium]|nr:trigger factor [Rickettsiales bacterium]
METQIIQTLDEGTKKQYQVIVPNQVILTNLEQELLEIQKNAKIDGFRAGKAPVNIIKSKYQDRILKSIIGEQVRKSVIKKIEEEDLEIIKLSEIDLESIKIKPEQDFTTSITVITYPKIENVNLKEITLERSFVKASAETTEKAIKSFAEQQSTLKEIENTNYLTENGNVALIDYLGKIDGTPFEGGEGKNYKLKLGSKSFIDNFEQQLIGKKAGEELLVKVQFPENYHNKDFSGKNAEFDVKIHKIFESITPEINDQFVKENLKLENLEELTKLIKKDIELSQNENFYHKFKEDMINFVDSNYKFELPQELIEERLNNNQQNQQSEDEIKKILKFEIFLNKIAKENSIKLENKDLQQELYEFGVKFYGQHQMVIDSFKNNKHFANIISKSAIEKKILEFITQNSSISKKEVFDTEIVEKI